MCENEVLLGIIYKHSLYSHFDRNGTPWLSQCQSETRDFLESLEDIYIYIFGQTAEY